MSTTMGFRRSSPYIGAGTLVVISYLYWATWNTPASKERAKADQLIGPITAQEVELSMALRAVVSAEKIPVPLHYCARYGSHQVTLRMKGSAPLLEVLQGIAMQIGCDLRFYDRHHHSFANPMFLCEPEEKDLITAQ